MQVLLGESLHCSQPFSDAGSTDSPLCQSVGVLLEVDDAIGPIGWPDHEVDKVIAQHEAVTLVVYFKQIDVPPVSQLGWPSNRLLQLHLFPRQNVHTLAYGANRPRVSKPTRVNVHLIDHSVGNPEPG